MQIGHMFKASYCVTASVIVLVVMAPRYRPVACAQETNGAKSHKHQQVLQSVLPELAAIQLGMSKQEVLKLRSTAMPLAAIRSTSGRGDEKPRNHEALVELVGVRSGLIDVPNRISQIASTKLDSAEVVRPLDASGAATYVFDAEKLVSIVVARRFAGDALIAERNKTLKQCLRILGDAVEYRVLDEGDQSSARGLPVVMWKVGDDVILLAGAPQGVEGKTAKPSLRVFLMRDTFFKTLPQLKYDSEVHKKAFDSFEMDLPKTKHVIN